MLANTEKIASSFRDPAGFLFHHDGQLFRQINVCFHGDYQHLMQSGLYQRLIEKRLLIPHEEVFDRQLDLSQVLIIKPEKIPFISYPYEWCFSQLKEAALLTLSIQKMALDYGMILKDASSYNVQFHQGRPIFIDTLSFEKYQPGSPWQAYRQFCQHFLAPLMLMCYRDVRLNQLLKIYIDGIPLDLASNLLPRLTKLKISPLLHIHFHAKLQKKYQKSVTIKQQNQRFTLTSLKRIMESLTHTIDKLHWKVQKNSEWYDYYLTNHNYSSEALNEKEKTIESWIKKIQPTILWDLGANTGRFSLLAAPHCQQVIAWDIDISCVESFYLKAYKHVSNVLPLTLDLTNPSPAIGWEHNERNSFLERGPVDTILALGLIHHLAIVNNVPLGKIAKFFSALCKFLIIEFIPKEDSQVRKLLATRKDIFDRYTIADFENEFKQYFAVLEIYPLIEGKRILYLLKAVK